MFFYDKKDIGIAIKYFRILNKNMSQKDLARRLKCSSGQISRYEHGKVNCTLERIKEICNIFGISTYQFREEVERIMRLTN